jgi:hypothetical protein
LGSSFASKSDRTDVLTLRGRVASSRLDYALLLELVRELLDFLEDDFLAPTCPVHTSYVIDENEVCLILLRLFSNLRCLRSALE